MRKLLAVLVLTLSIGACSDDPAVPATAAVDARLEELAQLGWGSLEAGHHDGDLLRRLAQLPPDLALRPEQRGAIAEIIEAFRGASAADRDALAAILAQAAEARRAGKPPEEVRAILAAGAPIRQRLHDAEVRMRGAIVAVLTPAQRAWLHDRPLPPRPCSTLTDAQRLEITALFAAFEQTNAADLAHIRSVHERARAAHLAGVPRHEVLAILAEARDAADRVRQARIQLIEAVRAVLTPEQRAAGCFR
jgi:Spy/CpxP family protein refolding chaperone